jgi:hypothetical protein
MPSGLLDELANATSAPSRPQLGAAQENERRWLREARWPRIASTEDHWRQANSLSGAVSGAASSRSVPISRLHR